MADEYLRMISDPDCPDDSRWLSRREKELRTLAIKKENQSSIKMAAEYFNAAASTPQSPPPISHP